MKTIQLQAAQGTNGAELHYAIGDLLIRVRNESNANMYFWLISYAIFIALILFCKFFIFV